MYYLGRNLWNLLCQRLREKERQRGEGYQEWLVGRGVDDARCANLGVSSKYVKFGCRRKTVPSVKASGGRTDIEDRWVRR